MLGIFFALFYDAFYIFYHYKNSRELIVESLVPIASYFLAFSVFFTIMGLKRLNERREQFFLQLAIEIQGNENSEILKIFPEGLLISKVKFKKIGTTQFLEE